MKSQQPSFTSYVGSDNGTIDQMRASNASEGMIHQWMFYCLRPNLDPYQRLQEAVLWKAIDDMVTGKNPDPQWFQSRESDSPFSYVGICESLGLDPSYLLKKLQLEFPTFFNKREKKNGYRTLQSLDENIAKLKAEGVSGKQIAYQLGITVENLYYRVSKAKKRMENMA